MAFLLFRFLGSAAPSLTEKKNSRIKVLLLSLSRFQGLPVNRRAIKSHSSVALFCRCIPYTGHLLITKKPDVLIEVLRYTVFWLKWTYATIEVLRYTVFWLKWTHATIEVLRYTVFWRKWFLNDRDTPFMFHGCRCVPKPWDFSSGIEAVLFFLQITFLG